jgi:predicted CoA-substrate-specific enzyme activase
MRKWTLGVDIGSVTLKIVLLDETHELVYQSYTRTTGRPLDTLIDEIKIMRSKIAPDTSISAVGTTGSGRFLAAAFLGSDVVKNEITAHAVGALHYNPEIRTIIEIGGQDSKIIHIKDGRVYDFAMNTVCAAGTGAFLDQQAQRLKIPIRKFGAYALSGTESVRIAGRCSVFAESDMIHKQQAGYSGASICRGLSEAMVRNYLNNVARGKKLYSPVSFQGGVAYNEAIVQCFKQALPDCSIVVPPYVTVCGAIGVALLAYNNVCDGTTKFKGWRHGEFAVRPRVCHHCENECELFTLVQNNKPTAMWGGRCERGNKNFNSYSSRQSVFN